MNVHATPQPANIVNGLDIDGLQTLIERVSADSATGQTRWRVATAWQGQTHSRAQVDGFEMGGEAVQRRYVIDIDEPLELGGTDIYANPQEHLLAALNACITVGFTALCALNGVALEQLQIVTEGDIDLRGFFGLDATVAPGYPSLKSTVRVKGSASEAEFRRIFDMALATSPNVHNITKPVRLDTTLVVEA